MRVLVRTILSGMFVLVLSSASTANAAPVVVFPFVGTLSLYAPPGSYDPELVWFDPSVSFVITVDLTSGQGTAEMMSSTSFFAQYTWAMNNITLQVIDQNIAQANMMFSLDAPGLLGESFNVTALFSVSQIWDNANSQISYAITTLDGDGDGIPGNEMIEGPFPGYSFAFDMVLVPIPLPPAIWLLASGLFSFAGVSRFSRHLKVAAREA